jgi:hypothetical protein
MKKLLLSVWHKIAHCFGVLLGWLKVGLCFVTRHLGCKHCTDKAVSKKVSRKKPAKRRKRSTKKK